VKGLGVDKHTPCQRHQHYADPTEPSLHSSSRSFPLALQNLCAAANFGGRVGRCESRKMGKGDGYGFPQEGCVSERSEGTAGRAEELPHYPSDGSR